MVKKGNRIQPVPGNTQNLARFLGEWEKFVNLYQKGGFYSTKDKLYSTKDYRQPVDNINAAYRNLLKIARDIQREDVNIINKKYGDNKKITDSVFWKKMIEKRPLYATTDAEIDNMSFFKGNTKKDGTHYDEIREYAEGIHRASHDTQRNPEPYWKWFEGKSLWESDQPEVAQQIVDEEAKEAKETDEELEHRLINGFTDSFNKGEDKEYFEKLNQTDRAWLDKLADDYGKWADMDTTQQQKEFGEHRHGLLQQLHSSLTGSPSKNIPKTEEKPINTPVVEEPVSSETRGSETITDVKAADKKDDVVIDSETKQNEDKRDEKFNSTTDDYNDNEPDEDVKPKREKQHPNYPKLSFPNEDKGSKIVPTKRISREEVYEDAPEFSIPSDNISLISDNEGYSDLREAEIKQKMEQQREVADRNKKIAGNYIPDQRMYNNKGREVASQHMRTPKPNPIDLQLNPDEGAMPFLSDEAKQSYKQPVLIPQYTQPTNIHNLLSFDYAMTTNAEYMRSKIQEANNKMFPRKDIGDVRKMRKLRIDNNKNTALKGGMPMSAFFYR